MSRPSQEPHAYQLASLQTGRSCSGAPLAHRRRQSSLVSLQSQPLDEPPAPAAYRLSTTFEKHGFLANRPWSPDRKRTLPPSPLLGGHALCYNGTFHPWLFEFRSIVLRLSSCMSSWHRTTDGAATGRSRLQGLPLSIDHGTLRKEMPREESYIALFFYL